MSNCPEKLLLGEGTRGRRPLCRQTWRPADKYRLSPSPQPLMGGWERSLREGGGTGPPGPPLNKELFMV